MNIINKIKRINKKPQKEKKNNEQKTETIDELVQEVDSFVEENKRIAEETKQEKVDRLKNTKVKNPIKKLQIHKEIKKLEKEIQKEKEAKQQTKILIGCLAVFVLGIGFLELQAYNSKVHEINFVNNVDTLYVGDHLDLQYVVYPNSAEYEQKDIKVVLDNPDLVEKNNNYEAIAEGTIKASITYNGSTYDQKTIEIKPVEVQSIAVNDYDLGLNLKKEVELKYYPENSTHKQFSLSSSNSKVVRIEDNSIIGTGEGEARITVKSVDGPEATFNVNVMYIKPEEISITGSSGTITTDSKNKLAAKLNPSEISDLSPNIVWSSSNDNVVSIDEEGNLKPNNRGTAVITAKYDDELYATKEIQVVYPNPSNIELSADPDEVYEGSTLKVTATIYPSIVENDTLTWSSSDESIATVNSNGVVTGKSRGRVVITAKTINGKMDDINIWINDRPASSGGETGGGKGNYSGNGEVYISDNGDRFHTTTFCHGTHLSNPQLVSVEYAKSHGFSACYWCARGY